MMANVKKITTCNLLCSVSCSIIGSSYNLYEQVEWDFGLLWTLHCIWCLFEIYTYILYGEMCFTSERVWVMPYMPKCVSINCSKLKIHVQIQTQ